MSKYSVMTQAIYTYVNYSSYVVSQLRTVVISHLDHFQLKMLRGHVLMK
jgi:hypothetical protein